MAIGVAVVGAMVIVGAGIAFEEKLVEQGAVASYADAARQLGVTRARMTQITNLLNLPPRVQEGLLLGDLHFSERRIRALVANPEWGESSLGGTVVQNQE